MKTNLDLKFKMNDQFEKEGIDVEVAEGVFFKVKRFGGFNSQKVKAAVNEYLKPFAKKIEANALAPEKEYEIQVKVFVKSCLVGWSGVKEENENGELSDIPYSEENAIKLLIRLRGLFDTLVAEATNEANYKEVLGNG